MHTSHRIPFQERNTRLRGLLDLAGGCYPRFLFGGSIGNCLPVFHFHQATVEGLEPYLRYLAENSYATVTSEAITALALRGLHPGKNKVALCFDDAWASLWTVAAPLLRRYGFQAITYAIPGRISDRSGLRPTLDDHFKDFSGPDPDVDSSETPCVTWDELRALHSSGTIDVQAHTRWHAMIFCDATVQGFITPTFQAHIHEMPMLRHAPEPAFLTPGELGMPLYAKRSAMSDACMYSNPQAWVSCRELVRQSGEAAFFKRKGWQEALRKQCQKFSGRYESEEQRDTRIFQELVQARQILNDALRTSSVRQMCFPWAIAGESARRLAARAGYQAAFSDRLFGFRAVRANDPAYSLMRLRHEFIFCLPGRGRRRFWHIVRRKA